VNRQLKRANEKSDRRREREQARRKEQRRAGRVRITKAKDTATTENKESRNDARPAPGTRRPGLAGLYLLLVIGVVAAQALVPPQTDPVSLVIHVLFYLILGYFLSLWFYRRGVGQAFIIALVGGLLLAFGVEGLKVALPQTEPNLLFAYLALPGLLPGAWLGRFIFQRSR
jgi:hypothetical protein